MSEALQHLNVLPVREGSRFTLSDEPNLASTHIVLDASVSAQPSTTSIGSPVVMQVAEGTLVGEGAALLRAENLGEHQQLQLGTGYRSTTLVAFEGMWQPVAQWEGPLQASMEEPVQFFLSVEVAPSPKGAARALPSEDLFRQLARVRPAELARHLREPSYSAGLRARAAEAAGDIADTPTALSVLLPLLADPEPIVREGAIYGLHRHLVPEVKHRLKDLAEAKDTTEGVRMAALEALDED